MDKEIAQRKLSVWWFINAAVIGLLFVVLTLTNKFEGKNGDGWQWVSQNIVPTLTLMIGTFVVKNTKDAPILIDKFYYRLALYSSIFYFVILYLTVFLAPVIFNLVGTSFLDILNGSKIYLNIIQGIVTLVLGIFFKKS